MMDSSEPTSEIQRFFNEQNVFITGGTGFMGKVLIEKLLRSCPGINKIYILVRPKKSFNAQERIEKFLSSSVFDVLSETYPIYREKIVGIPGDATLPGFGLSAEDRALIANEVSVVFHMAAAVRFDEPLSVALNINVNCVKDVIDLSKECTKFKAGVYVSTAYSNCVKNKIEEVAYDPPLTYEDCKALEKIIEKRQWAEKELDDVTKMIIGKWPNTYTFTKAIAESLITTEAKSLPFSIIRPSIVIGTYKEPEPGWINVLLGPSGYLVGVGIGAIHAALLDQNLRVDLVPCDMACMAIIATAWETGTEYKKSNEMIPIYNFVNQYPISWEDLHKLGLKSFFKNPSTYTVYYPFFLATTSPVVFAVYQFFLHMIPALLLDFLGRFRGHKPMMYNVYQKANKMSKILRFFMEQQWEFDNRNLKRLWQRMNEKDKELFPFLSDSFSWEECINGYILGMKKIYTNYILREKKFFIVKEDNPENARKHLRKLYIVHLAVTTVFFGLCLWLLWTIFNTVLYYTTT